MMFDLDIPAGVKRDLVFVYDTAESSERTIRLKGEGAQVSVEEIFLRGGVKSTLSIIHETQGTTSRIRSRGIVGKNEFSKAHARIVIPKDAQRSDSFVSQEFLLLDDSAKVEALPALEIEADDVRAGHKATIAPMDEEALFYLTSRGFSEGEAKDVIIKAFLRVPQEYEHMVIAWR